MALPAGWTDFVKEYRADRHFQYFPHAHVGTPRFAKIVELLATFQGRVWNENAVMKAVRKEKLSAGVSSGARMIRKATENLGFCWFNDHILTMTPAGLAFIDGTNRSDVMERLLWRYRLSNPVNEGAIGFDIFPHIALLRILCSLDDLSVTRDEFILFVGRCRTDADIPKAIEYIKKWRSLSVKEEDSVMAALPSTELERRRTDISYVMGFHATAPYLSRFDDKRRRKGIKISAGQDKKIRERLKLPPSEDIELKDAQAWIAYHGSSEKAADPLANLDHLLDTSQWTEAIEAFKKLPVALRGGRTPKQFEADVFLERDLEDYLVERLDLIEPGLKLKHRQYGIKVGVIDLLATAKNGDLVIIELKKVRASDKVFGQLCRYVGYLATEAAPKAAKVRGYIVGSEIDVKLKYAAMVAPQGIVGLKWFRRNPQSKEIFIESDI